MTDSKYCMNFQTTESKKFRSLKDKKWEEAENNNLTKEIWVKCVEEVEVTTREDVTCKDVGTTMEDRGITNEKEGPIYSYEELQEVFQTNKCLEIFLDQLYLAARPLEHEKKTMNHIKKLIVHVCYLLASLNNAKINFFKFDVVFYLDSVGTSNKGLDTLANLGVTTTSRAMDQRK
ncbi:hypothetical protein C2G38_2158824 [Gigaspora rosea]|uniref:Uncharacterized protein n=1 Tax=Gigaspora rosea TaxID=44941 RepID=A0A397W000_9GLOM|nr:hypothetical protein C2G38_2158824 [Gigaspora rosea]